MEVLSHYLKWRIGITPPQTQTTEAERSCITTHARGKHHLVEIGVWHGVTTKLMRASMASNGVLFAVDPFMVGRLGVSLQQKIAHSEVGRSSHGEVRWIRSLGADALLMAKAQGLEAVDFIFIDGDHSFEGLKSDWNLWTPLVSLGGIVALHDSRSTPTRDLEKAGSTIFTQNHVLNNPQFQVVEQVDSLTVLKKRSD